MIGFPGLPPNMDHLVDSLFRSRINVVVLNSVDKVLFNRLYKIMSDLRQVPIVDSSLPNGILKSYSGLNRNIRLSFFRAFSSVLERYGEFNALLKCHIVSSEILTYRLLKLLAAHRLLKMHTRIMDQHTSARRF
jgi:hypothetical protein